jgi:predicted Zn-dependent protease
MKPLKISTVLIAVLMLNLGSLAVQPKLHAQGRASIPSVEGLLVKDFSLSTNQMLDQIAQARGSPSSKLASEDFYNQARKQLPSNLYLLYRIVERIVRANELEVPFWMIRVISSDSPHASAHGAYVLILDESILDLTEGNLSAMAFIVSHEMAHHTLGHQAKYLQIERETEAMVEESLSKVETVDQVMTEMIRVRGEAKQRFEELIHTMELEADRTAYFYIAQAGFEPEGSLQTYEAFERLYGADKDLTKRIEALRLVIEQNPAEKLAAQGRIRLENTKPLPYELSDDNESLKIKLRSTDYPSDIDEFLD